MVSQNSNNKIAKNTLFLYIRMMIILMIGLYTSRVILKALGVMDYGINNVVGGVVTMFSVIGGALSGAISRFITFELGKDNLIQLKKVFSISLTIQVVMAFIALLLLETIGLWFLNCKMNIPTERLNAANWVYQSAIICFVINLLSVPYNATIIAHEKMSIFAYISIIESALKLAVVFILFVSVYDRLKIYAVLLVLVALFVRFLYGWYCSKNFSECHYKFTYDKMLIRKIGNYAGWTFFSGVGNMLCTQGLNILINLYFGVVVNTARGLVVQADGVIKSFVNNFTTALSPQIVKTYAKGEKDKMINLAYCGSKFTAYLMIFIAIPLLVETSEVLRLWLGNVPKFSVAFLRMSLITSFFDTALVISFRDCINATGNIKYYQLATTLCLWLIFPFSWLAYSWGASPIYGYIINFIVVVILMFLRLSIVVKTLKFPMKLYLRTVLLRVIIVFSMSYLISHGLTLLVDEGLARFLIVCICSSIVTFTSICLFGLTKNEKNFLLEIIKTKWKKLH